MWGSVKWAISSVRTYLRLARAAAKVEHDGLDSNVYTFVLMRRANEPAVSLYRTDGTTGAELFGGADDGAYLDEVDEEDGEGDDDDDDDDDGLGDLDDLLADDLGE